MIAERINKSVDLLRARYDLSKREQRDIADAMFRELRAGGGKWSQPTGTNDRLFRVINALQARRKQLGTQRLKRRDLIWEASAMLKNILESNSLKGANAA